MGMAILPTFPLKPQDAHVSDSNIGLMSRPVSPPPSSHFLFQEFLPTSCLFGQCLVRRHSFQRPTCNNFKIIPEQWQLVWNHHHLWEVTKVSTICISLHLLCYFSCHINPSYVTSHQLPAVCFSFAKPESLTFNAIFIAFPALSTASIH